MQRNTTFFFVRTQEMVVAQNDIREITVLQKAKLLNVLAFVLVLLSECIFTRSKQRLRTSCVTSVDHVCDGVRASSYMGRSFCDGFLLCLPDCTTEQHFEMHIDILSLCELGHRLAAHPPRSGVNTGAYLRKTALRPLNCLLYIYTQAHIYKCILITSPFVNIHF